METQVLVQRWIDATTAMADAALLCNDLVAAKTYQIEAEEIEKNLAASGYNIKDLVCP